MEKQEKERIISSIVQVLSTYSDGIPPRELIRKIQAEFPGISDWTLIRVTRSLVPNTINKPTRGIYRLRGCPKR